MGGPEPRAHPRRVDPALRRQDRGALRRPVDAVAAELAEPYLVIDQVTKRFGPFVALDRVSLAVRDGEFVCFLGPSGCGKTTLLRAIAGLELQSEGAIRQKGQDISLLPPSARDFGIVFQSYALFPNLTVADNVGYGLVGRGLRRGAIQARIDELLRLVGLPDQGPKYPAQLSGGQQQRVALARALATSPGLLLLDEPLSALDAKVRQRLRLEMKDLQRRLGVTTIMVTHDQDEALTMADRIVVMNEGVIEQIGTPEEVYTRPATAFVADFIGEMNFLDGALTDAAAVRVGNLTLALPAPVASGPEVTIGIRPEDVRIDDAHGIEAQVHHVEFLGAHVRVSLDHEAFGPRGLVADLAQNLYRARGGVAVGERLRLGLPPERLLVYGRS
ncbi:MAG: putative 2-aminoethylphosphonate ABC transporter ATP-binding protein [Geminicoccaceae bacterium]|nr:MAG: putative 2-aminoethylphosphonate ABC transporter ATP-binding protein [Geminicoccaceae bacterium]